MSLTSRPEEIKSIAPLGRLRTTINVGNPILATWNAHKTDVDGISVDLAKSLAAQIGLELELIPLESAGEAVKVVTNEDADFGFFALDPKRASHIFFSTPYILIEGCYLTHKTSKITENDQVDQNHISVVVGKGSAYDLYLTRTLKYASIVRAPTSPTVVEYFVKSEALVAAGVRQQLEEDIKKYEDLKIFEKSFMTIQQAMGIPRSRPEAAQVLLQRFMMDALKSGLIHQLIEKHKINGANVYEAF